MDLQLKDAQAFVSGSTAGIGYAIARSLAAEGAHVILNGRSEASVNQAVERLQSDVGPAVTIKGIAADFAKSTDIARLVDQIRHVDVLINNVGYFEPKPFTEISEAEWLDMFQVNVMSGVKLSQAALPEMLKRDRGRIVFISSESALQIPGEMIHYGMTKTAQLAIANGLAREVKGSGVTVNSVLPGPTYSEGVQKFVQDLARDRGTTPEEQQRKFFEETRPLSTLQRFATVEEVAAAVTFLCSPLAAASNGIALRTDGGIVQSLH